MKLKLPPNEIMVQATIVVALLVILSVLDEILHYLRTRPYVVIDYAPVAEPVTIDATAAEIKKPTRARRNGRFAKAENDPPIE